MSAHGVDAQRPLLERRLLRRRSTGEVTLRALDPFRAAGDPPDPRAGEALDRLRARRDPHGRWPLEVQYRDTLHEGMAGDEGAPNRWITLRALRALDWATAHEDDR